MAPRAGKSVRVLSNPSHVAPLKRRGPARLLSSPPPQMSFPMKHVVKTCEKKKAKPATRVMRSASVKSRPPPRRRVERLPLRLETDVGRRAQTGRMTILEERSVSAEVQHQYHKYFAMFENFCQTSGISWPPGDQVDLALADFLDVMFVEGRSANEGEKVVASVEYHLLESKGTLAHSRRALRGWRKEKPPQSRLPLPALLAEGMAMVLLGQGRQLKAIKLLVDHDTYLRPGESIDLRGKGLVVPIMGGGQQYRHYNLVVRDAEAGKPDKVGVYDNNVPFNTPGKEYLGQILHQHVAQLNKPEDKIYNFSSADFRKDFAEAGKILGISGLHPYQLRHGGAAEQLHSGVRDHAAVKARGRWHTDQSVRRYTKTGKIQQLLSKLSPVSLEFCRWSKQNMEQVLRGSIRPRVPL